MFQEDLEKMLLNEPGTQKSRKNSRNINSWRGKLEGSNRATNNNNKKRGGDLRLLPRSDFCRKSQDHSLFLAVVQILEEVKLYEIMKADSGRFLILPFPSMMNLTLIR